MPFANEIIPQYEMVVATQDWHPPDHQSFASQHPGKCVGNVIRLDGVDQVLWPDHCVQNSYGADFARDLNRDGIGHVVQKGMDRAVDSYSGFFDNARRRETGLEAYLRSHGVDTVHVMGLATDYCVKATALDAIELGFATFLLTKGIRGVNLKLGDCQRAIDQMRGAGVQIA